MIIFNPTLPPRKKGDKRKMEQIERDLQRLGMDRMTLLAVVADLEKTQ